MAQTVSLDLNPLTSGLEAEAMPTMVCNSSSCLSKDYIQWLPLIKKWRENFWRFSSPDGSFMTKKYSYFRVQAK
jgi:hypothetical protein